MRIEIRNDSVEIDGYVNAVGRDSKPLNGDTGKFVEQIAPGTFKTALSRAENVELLLNHQTAKKLGDIKSKNLELYEDSIGLRANCTITDPDVIEIARRGDLVGWSFGMYVNDSKFEQRAEDLPRRIVTDIDIFEVSIIDRTMSPCYAGTSIECRAEDEKQLEVRSLPSENIRRIDNVKVDFTEIDKRIENLRRN